MEMSIVFVIVGVSLMVLMLIIYAVFSRRMLSRKSIEKTLTEYADMAVKVRSNVINNNEELLRETANKSADIQKGAIRSMAGSVKEGFTQESKIYCKYCGASIDSDSVFCNKCGKQL